MLASVKLLIMKILDGSELVGYIKERQAKQVRALRQSWRVLPRLAIVRTGDNPVIDVYMRLKKTYAEDILTKISPETIKSLGKILNKVSGGRVNGSQTTQKDGVEARQKTF